MKYDIFISYRREGGRDYARQVELALKAHGYQNIFFDYNSIRNGVFNTQIIDAICGCKDFILILSEGSMDRCVNEDDWVRKEISTALEAGCNIIPLKIDNNNVIFPEGFPKKLNFIKMIQFSTLLTNEFFDDSIKHITERLSSTPVSTSSSIKDEDIFELTIITDETCEFFIGNERISKIRSGKFLRVKDLKIGEHYSFIFKSLSSKNLSISVSYEVPQFKKNDELSISFNEEKEKKNKEFLLEKEKTKKARELKALNKESLRLMLKEYDKHDMNSYDGMRLVCKDELYGFLDEQGNEIIPCMYPNALHFSEGLACVYDSDQWTYIDRFGTSVGITSDSPSYMTNDSIIVSKNGKFGIINKLGECLIDYKFDIILLPYNKVYAGRKDGKFIYFNIKGERLNPYSFDFIMFRPIDSSVGEDKDIFADQKKKDELFSEFVVDPEFGDLLIDFYDSYYEFLHNDNVMKQVLLPSLVKINKLMGKVDENANQIIPCVADNLNDDWKRNVVFAERNGKFGLFDSKTGKVLIPMIYRCLDSNNLNQDMILFASKDTYSNENVKSWEKHLRYIENGTLGVLGLKGELLIPLEYNYIHDYSFSIFWGISILDKDCDVDIGRLFELMELIDVDTFRKQNKYSEKEGLEYETLLNKIHFKKDVYSIYNWTSNCSRVYSCNMISSCDCNRGVKKIEFANSDSIEFNEESIIMSLSQHRFELSMMREIIDNDITNMDDFYDYSKKNLTDDDISEFFAYEFKSIVVTDSFSIENFDLIENTKRQGISIVSKNGLYGVYDNYNRKLLTNVSFDSLKWSLFNDKFNVESKYDKMSLFFDFEKNNVYGIFRLILSPDGKIYYDDWYLRNSLKEWEIKAIFD